MTNASAEIMNPAPPVINEFFVNIVPGFSSPQRTPRTGLATSAATARLNSWAIICWALPAAARWLRASSLMRSAMCWV